MTGNLKSYRATYPSPAQAKKAWQEGAQFVLCSNGHALDGLLVTRSIFCPGDCFRLILSNGKTIEVRI